MNLPAQTIRVTGQVTITVRDAVTGRIVSEETVQNIVTTAGLVLICDLLKEDTSVGLNFFAVGTTNTAPAVTDTTLAAEVARLNITQQSRTAAALLTVTMFLPTTAANGNTLVEIGIFDLTAAGVMFSRAIYTGIVKTASVTVTYSWTFTLSSS